MNAFTNGETHTMMTPDERGIAADDNRTQHIRLTFAMHRLEACLGQAAPGREAKWLSEVERTLDLLSAAMAESKDLVCRDDGLIEEIKHSTPRLLPRIANLQREFEALVNQCNTLQSEISEARERGHAEFADIRQRIEWLLAALRHHQGKETDLIYEAINVDIGIGD